MSLYRYLLLTLSTRTLLILLLLTVLFGNLSYGSDRERHRTIIRSPEMRAQIESEPERAFRLNFERARQYRFPTHFQIAKASTTIELEYLKQRFAFGTWQDAERVLLVIDDAGRIVENIFQIYSNGEWVNDDRFVFIYEGAGQYPSIIIWQDWDQQESDWVNLEREFLTYDNQGREIEVITEEWDEDEWIPFERVELTYTDDGRMLEVRGYYWWFDEWDLDYRVLWVYDNGVLLRVDYDYWDGEEWFTESRTVYEYDEVGNNISQVYLWYDDFDDEWLSEIRYLYSYDNEGNQVESIFQYWDDEWINLMRTTYGYDSRGNSIEEIRYFWGGEDWMFSTRISNQYDPNDNLEMRLIEDWTGDDWRYVERYLFGDFDPTYVAVDDGLPRRFELMQNYPNPFNPSTTIRFSIPEQSGVTLTIYDVLGRKIAVLIDDELDAGTYEHVFDASHLASGLFLYQLRAGDRVETKRLMLLK